MRHITGYRRPDPAGDYLAGRDAQLSRAVDVLKEELRRLGPQRVPGRQ